MALSFNRVVGKRKAKLLKTRPQVRKSFPAEDVLRALAKSVMKGQLHPLIVLPEDFLLDGECRWRGMMLENPEFEFDTIHVDRELTPAEAGELQLISALHSTTLTAYDQAVACRNWLNETGGTAKELAEKIDRDQSMVSRLNALWKTAPAVQQAAAEGKIGPKGWHQIGLLPEADQEPALAQILSGAPVRALEEKRKLKPKNQKPNAPRLSRVGLALTTGMKIVVSGAEMTISELIAALAAAHDQAKKAEKEGITIKTLSKAMADKAKQRAGVP